MNNWTEFVSDLLWSPFVEWAGFNARSRAHENFDDRLNDNYKFKALGKVSRRIFLFVSLIQRNRHRTSVQLAWVKDISQIRAAETVNNPWHCRKDFLSLIRA